MKRRLKKELDEELYRHSLGVAEEARVLARRFGADEDQAYLAGLVHDYAKRYSKKEQIKKAEIHGIRLDRFARLENRLLHAPVGAVLVKKVLGITDPDVLRAVYFHTTGRRGMSLLEKVVYLADHIEPGRAYKGVEVIRKIASQNLDQALLLAVDNVIYSVLRRKLILSPRSLALRNELLENLKS